MKKTIKQVTPFGNSGHINVGKRYVGKYMNVEPSHPIKEFLTKKEIESIKKQISEELKKPTQGFTHSIYKHSIEEYKNNLENIDYVDDIESLVGFLSMDEIKNKAIIDKLKKILPEDDED